METHRTEDIKVLTMLCFPLFYWHSRLRHSQYLAVRIIILTFVKPLEDCITI